MALLRRRKCIIGATLVVEIVLFSIITFVIAYLTALNAIHHASQQLADSMVDTVSVRVVGYFESTEASVRQAALVNRYASLPADYAGPASWYTEWMLQMRSLMMAEQYQVWAFAMQFDDASDIAVSLYFGVNGSVSGGGSRLLDDASGGGWVFETVLDGRHAARFGYRPVLCSGWETATMQEHDVVALAKTAFPSARSPTVTLSPNYYVFRDVYDTRDPWCVWKPLSLNPEGLTYETAFDCAVINASGAYLGQLAAVRHISLLNTFLQQAAVTPNAEIFIFDGTLFLVAATTTDAIFTTSAGSNASNTAVLDSGCISSTIFANTSSPHVGCRASASTYSYAPLRSLAQMSDTAHYLASNVRVSAYLSLAGSMYFIVCMPVVVSAQASSSMFLILFLPEADVMSDVDNVLITAVLVCVTFCVVSAMLSSLLVATVVDVPRGQTLSVPPDNTPAVPSGAFPTVAQMGSDLNKMMVACRYFAQVKESDVAAPQIAAAEVLIASANATVASTNSTVVMVVTYPPDAEPSNLQQHRFVDIAALHSGRIVDVADVGEGRAAVMWQPDGEAGMRAVLCGLNLIREGVVTRAAVSQGASRHCEDTLTFVPPLRDALDLLSSAAANLAVVVRHGVLDLRDASNFFVVDELEGRAEVTAVAGDAWQHFPRRVRFDDDGSALPLRSLFAAAVNR